MAPLFAPYRSSLGEIDDAIFFEFLNALMAIQFWQPLLRRKFSFVLVNGTGLPRMRYFSFAMEIDEKIKSRRLSEIVELQQKHSLFRNKQKINQVVEILIEKESKKSANHWAGRNQQNSVVIIPKEEYSIGDFVNVKINDCTSATLIGKGLGYSKNN